MTAYVRNGRLEMDEPIELPEGAKVEFVIVKVDDNLPSALDHVAPWIGKAVGVPEDLARHHDHYVHGRPRL